MVKINQIKSTKILNRNKKLTKVKQKDPKIANATKNTTKLKEAIEKIVGSDEIIKQTKVKSKKIPKNDSVPAHKLEKVAKVSKISNTAKSSGKDKQKLTTTNGKKRTLKKTHKKDLDGLKDLKNIDPEFYQFLQKNDKELLEFNLFDSDDSDDEATNENSTANKGKTKPKSGKQKQEVLDSEDEDEEGNIEDDDNDEIDKDDEKFHKPTRDLEVASDESDFEDEELAVSPDGTQKITLNLLRQWQIELEKENVSLDVIRKATQAFNSALASLAADNENGMVPTVFKVVGGPAFNGVIQLCVLHLQPAILRFLNWNPRSNIPFHKCKKWTKLRGCLRYYLTDLIQLIEQVSSPKILSVLLKHLHQMAKMVSSFSTLGKTILKRLIVIWSSGEETIRVLAFLCILKITRSQQISMLNHVLKAMYLSYVRNSKFVSPNTLPGINFMRRSLVEMFALDLNFSYQHAFLYIRQLAIHLRNAVILKKKDSIQAVYNWQYVNSIRLWADLLGATASKPQLQPLIYPLVTITTGVIRLIPTAQYFPLRFHCLQSLISLAKETRTFIPLLPLILEVLRSNTFNKKHTAVSMRPILFTCILRLNKQQISENGFRDEVVEQVCGQALEYLAHLSTSLAFSDLVVPTVFALKNYLKECRNANYSRKIKQLLDKIQENSKFIDQERRKITFGLKDLSQVHAWETHMRNKGTPLDIYYNSWVKTHETKKRRQAAQVDDINSDYGVPKMSKQLKKINGVPVKNENGEVELFPSDSEDEHLQGLPSASEDNSDDERQQKSKKTKKDKKSKKNKEKSAKSLESKDMESVEVHNEDQDDNVDIVKDLDLDDW